MKSITQYIEEGFLRGYGGDIKDSLTFLGILDSIKALFGNSKKCLDIIDNKINEINYFIRSENFKGHTDTIGFLKFLNKLQFWRFYFVLHDETYNNIIKKTKDNTLSKILLDTEFSKRVIQSIYNSKSTQDLLKVTSLYQKRCHEYYNFCQKNKIGEDISANVLNIFAQGSIDLEYMIHKIIRYND